jgi:hypothetical protein
MNRPQAPQFTVFVLCAVLLPVLAIAAAGKRGFHIEPLHERFVVQGDAKGVIEYKGDQILVKIKELRLKMCSFCKSPSYVRSVRIGLAYKSKEEEWNVHEYSSPIPVNQTVPIPNGIRIENVTVTFGSNRMKDLENEWLLMQVGVDEDQGTVYSHERIPYESNFGKSN